MQIATSPMKTDAVPRTSRLQPSVNSRYDAVEITLHWATALLVITLYFLAQAWSFIHRGAPSRLEMQSTHVSLGICLAAVLVLRIAWRAGPGRRLPPATSGITEIASEGVHYLLYLLLLTVVGLGFCFRWSQHVPLNFFGWFVIPAPYPFSQSQTSPIGELHYWVATTIVVLAGGHACAALFHHYVLHDGVLCRMLPARGSRSGRVSL
jgi:cytochrome b561